MPTSSKLLLLSVLVAPLTGCVSSEQPLPDFGGGGGKADEASGDGIYAARLIQARCPGDHCRGLELRLVNHEEMTCPDGATAPSCLVMNPSISWAGTGLSDDIIKTVTMAMPYGSGTEGGMPVLLRAHNDGDKFAIDEVWVEVVDDVEASGPMVGVVQDADGLLLEQTLNVAGVSALGDIDLDSARLSQADTQEFYAALPKGVIIAGESSVGGDGTPVRSVTQFWIRND